ncbi:MAG: peptidoglycan-associated lipoprotein Pal [Desulfobulbaceae bacterium]|nr:peptidoglycan-associated lipoprotein Pal [Desulfobulbaceae bacterium]
MKTFARLLVIALFSALLLTLAACGKDPVPPYMSSKDSTGVPEATDIEYTSPVYSDDMQPSEELLDTSPMDDDQSSSGYGSAMDRESEEYKKTYGRSSEQLLPIYFDFDQASIRSDQFSRIEHNADYLNNNPSAKVIIEGNCDERGTNEYNLALGERRALNAKTYLIELGIDEYRIRTVSYGEERPLFTAQDEFSWAQNRRNDFVLE